MSSDSVWNWIEVARDLPCKPPNSCFPKRGPKRSQAILDFCHNTVETTIKQISGFTEIPLDETQIPAKSNPAVYWSLQLMKNSGIEFRMQSKSVMTELTGQDCRGVYYRKVYVKKIAGLEIFIPQRDHEYIGLIHPLLLLHFNTFIKTAFHEMAHWTLHEDRLDRSLRVPSEEVLADMTAICLLKQAGFDETTLNDAYQDLKNNFRLHCYTYPEMRKIVPEIARTVEYLLDPDAFLEWRFLPLWIPRPSIRKSRKNHFLRNTQEYVFATKPGKKSHSYP